MDYFTVPFEAGAKLGISVIARNASQPLLGNTVVESVPSTASFAFSKGIRAGDFIVSVNDMYVSHIPHDQCVRKLQQVLEKRVMVTIQFCRPNKFEWSRVKADMNAIVHEGILQKQSGSLMKRWTPRYVKLTRETFSYYSEGTLRKKININDIKLVKLQNRTCFGLICSGKEMELDAGDVASANLWQHALECAIKRSFDRDIPPDAYEQQQTQRNDPPRNPNTAPPASYPNNPNNLNTDYLNLGRMNINQKPMQTQAQTPNSTTQHHQPGTAKSNAAAQHYKNPYWMLLLCKLETASGPDGAVFLGNVPNPATMQWKNPDYSFSLEKRILEKEFSQETS